MIKKVLPCASLQRWWCVCLAGFPSPLHLLTHLTHPRLPHSTPQLHFTLLSLSLQLHFTSLHSLTSLNITLLHVSHLLHFTYSLQLHLTSLHFTPQPFTSRPDTPATPKASSLHLSLPYFTTQPLTSPPNTPSAPSLHLHLSTHIFPPQPPLVEQ